MLVGLVDAPWHERHKDVVDALAKLKAPKSIDALWRTALATFPYRAYDEFSSLGVKCVRALGAIRAKEAVVRLGDLLASGEPILEQAAHSQLPRLDGDGVPAEIRVIARAALAVQSASAKQ